MAFAGGTRTHTRRLSTSGSSGAKFATLVIAFSPSGDFEARGRESGVELDSPMGWVWTIRDGKLLKAQGFLGEAEALEAAGLREDR